jgi:hypothetical protein
MALAAEPGNVVTVSYRKGAFTRLKPRNAERIAAHLRDGKLRVVFNSQPQEVRPGSVLLEIKTDGNERVEEVRNDFVYCLLGADLPNVWLQQLGVHYIQKPEGWNPGPTDAIVIRPQPIAA